MIGAIRRSGQIGLVRVYRTTDRVEAAAPAGDAGHRDREPPQAAVHSIVPKFVAPEPRPPVRLSPSAPFIAQLAAAHLGDLSAADRRVRRNDGAVAPRATGTYRATDRIATDIEPGFLVKREV